MSALVGAKEAAWERAEIMNAALVGTENPYRPRPKPQTTRDDYHDLLRRFGKAVPPAVPAEA